MHDLLVIGGGPGGVAATAYGLQLGLDTLLVGPELGGKINYPFSIQGLENVETVHGATLVRTFAAKIDADHHRAAAASRVERVAGGFRVTSDADEAFEGRTLVVATGARPRRLYVPGEEEYWGRGLSFSAVSHAPLFAGREVAVIGNDRRAQVAALELARLAHQVRFIAPQPQKLDDTLLARLAEQGNVDLFRSWEVVSFEGNRFLSGLTLQNTEGAQRQLAVEGAFVEMGLLPNSDLVRHLVERDARGHIRVDQNAATSDPAIFAAGDVSNVHGEQVPIAIGEGIKAALSASEYLAGAVIEETE